MYSGTLLAFYESKQLKFTAMKSRIATILIACCFFFSGTAFAVTPVTPKATTSKVIANLLKEELKYPKFAREGNFECCVLVRLTINDDGSFSVECVNCTSKEMKFHVKKAIEQISKKELAKYAGQTFSYKINFKLI